MSRILSVVRIAGPPAAEPDESFFVNNNLLQEEIAFLLQRGKDELLLHLPGVPFPIERDKKRRCRTMQIHFHFGPPLP
jgi:hypothetical protein